MGPFQAFQTIISPALPILFCAPDNISDVPRLRMNITAHMRCGLVTTTVWLDGKCLTVSKMLAASPERKTIYQKIFCIIFGQYNRCLWEFDLSYFHFFKPRGKSDSEKTGTSCQSGEWDVLLRVDETPQIIDHDIVVLKKILLRWTQIGNRPPFLAQGPSGQWHRYLSWMH